MKRLLACLLTLSCSARAEEAGPGVRDLDAGELAAKISADQTCLKGWAEGLKDLVDRAEARNELFTEHPERWTLDEDRELRDLWAGLLDHLYALEGLQRFYAGYGKLASPAREEAFALGHAARVSQYAEGLRWIELSRARKRLETLLDEPDAGRGVPERAFADLKFRFLHVSAMTRFSLADRRFRKQADGIADPWLKAFPVQAADRIRDVLRRRGLQDLIGNGKDILDDALFEAWFPAQKGIAEWMGDTRVKRLKRNLVNVAQARQMAASCRPGDLVIERRNWYLSNVGLPGFWPHAVLYVGTPGDLAGSFDSDPGTQAWLAGLPGSPPTLAKALEGACPEAWKAYLASDTQGHPKRVMEAVSEGVIFHPVEESFCGDYVAALRPRLKPADKAKALLEAFRHHGKPYDFNFDFVTDSCLVCSELCYKAYLPGAGKEGLRIPLATVCGRKTLPPNDIIRLYDQEAEREERQFDFVYFLDGRERSRDAVVSDAAALRASWRRPKWDIAQK